ncbi:MAG: transcriptional regulator, GntR family, partial [candidate division NC10 bacterium]|nr:transcriptional regulator, GntR family [candidate division NC10 bacterium]
ALGMTAEDMVVDVLSLVGVRPTPVQGAVEILLVECNREALDFFAKELEAHLPVRVAKVLLGDLTAAGPGRKPAGRWQAAVVASADVETAHNLEHSIVNAGLPNIALIGSCPAEGAALGRLVRQVEVMVCSTSAAERVRALAGSAVQVIMDDRALDKRGIEMLAAILVGQEGEAPAAPGSTGRRRSPRPSSRNPPSPGEAHQAPGEK